MKIRKIQRKNEFYAFLAVCRPIIHKNDIWAMRCLWKPNIDHSRPVFWSQATPNCYEWLWILKGSMLRHYSSSFGVFGVLQGKKIAKNGPKLPEIGPKSVLSRYWVLWRSQDIPNGYRWVHIAESCMPTHYPSNIGVFEVLQGIKLAKNGPKFTGNWPQICIIPLLSTLAVSRHSKWL